MILAEQNPWHRGTVPDVLAPPMERPLVAHLWQRLEHDEPRRFLVVLDARRVGKTTAMYQTVRHLLNAGIDPGRCGGYASTIPCYYASHWPISSAGW